MLLVLVKDYEDKNIRLPELDPIEAVKLKMEERGSKAKDLEPLVGSKGHMSSVLSRRRELTLNAANGRVNVFNLLNKTLPAMSLVTLRQYINFIKR